MSGIFGIFSFHGEPVDQELVSGLLEQLQFRGSDKQNAWHSGNIALGHSLLATTFESHKEKQPLCFEGKYCLVADARIDGRKALTRQLEAKGQAVPRNPTDPELIVQAYDAWGTDCAKHLIGDFSFAIWDRPRGRLFCARDHYGVKPFFFTRTGKVLIFSNSLNCLRQHPGISSALNNQAILDFLLFGENLELTTSVFEEIERLPPAHHLLADGRGLRITEYWRLSPSAKIRYKRSADYIDHFSHVFNAAVSDRLRSKRTSIEMSGGLDSTSIAATAKSAIDRSDRLESLRAYTFIYDSLIPDEERHYSDIAASHLGIDLVHFPGDGCDLLSGDTDPRCQTPEPLDNPYKSLMLEYGKTLSGFSRVCLNGQGGDEILRGQTAMSMIGKTGPGDILAQLKVCLLDHHLRPPLGIRSLLKKSRNKQQTPELPRWVRSSLLEACDGRRRWERYWRPSLLEPSHLRSEALPRFLPGFRWTQYVETYDPETLRAPIEYRWPFLDIRLVQDLLAFPPLPWFADKLILRASMLGQIPEIIRTRPKTPLRGFPYLELLKQKRIVWAGFAGPGSQLHEFVDIKQLDLPTDRSLNADNAVLWMRPMLLYNWLQTPQ